MKKKQKRFCASCLYWSHRDYDQHQCMATFNLLKIFYFMFICLAMLGLSCSTWDLSLWPMGARFRPGIEPGFPVLRAQSPRHWTIREVPSLFNMIFGHYCAVFYLVLNTLFLFIH